MELFEKLGTVAIRQSVEGEFPDWLLNEVMAIVAEPELYREKSNLVETLVSQIGNFDLYAGTGCFDDSVGTGAIQVTIDQIVTRQQDKR